MSSTVFTGPVLAGNVLQSDGTGSLAGVGGSSGTQNVGFVSMMSISNVNGVFNSPLAQTTSAVATGIVIPAGSIITDIYLYTTTALTNSGTVSIGTTAANANELATGVAGTQGQTTVVPTSTISAWLAPNNTQDFQVYVKSSAAGAGNCSRSLVASRMPRQRSTDVPSASAARPWSSWSPSCFAP